MGPVLHRPALLAEHAVSVGALHNLNDRPEVHELFREFQVETVSTRYSAQARSSRRVNELLISNAHC